MSREDECDPECVSNIIQLWIEGILIPTIAVFGILGNIFCLFILSNKSVELKPSFANLLKCLSVYDTALLVSWLLLLMIKEGFIKSLIFSNPPFWTPVSFSRGWKYKEPFPMFPGSGWDVAPVQPALPLHWVPPGGQASPHSLSPPADPGGAHGEPLHRGNGRLRKIPKHTQTFLSQRHGNLSTSLIMWLLNI